MYKFRKGDIIYKHFNELRNSYPHFYYNSYSYEVDDNYLNITWNFEIDNLTTFNPSIKIKIDNLNITDKDNNFIDYLVFHLGLIELISYWKATCSPNVIVKCGYLDEYQINWFKKLYYNGLGEFFYVNHINIDEVNFMNLTTIGKNKKFSNLNYQGNGNLIPIGGGKDSVVSLELLKDYYDNNTAFMINPKVPMLECAKVAGYDSNKTIEVKRVIDANLLKLNKEGYLNGHTPFSSMVAFLTYLVAYLSSKKYIILSNEASANESTVIDTNINHQYSKTYEFENDFNSYTHKYFQIDINYFSLLRGLSEFQIAYLFSKFEKYHLVFRSCNVGSKNNPWNWCSNCAKCLFVYIILSPFLYKEKLIKIFNNDLFDNNELLDIFLELTGNSDTKPFECVGTISEVRYALSLTINNLLKRKEKLPYLLDYYYKNYKLEDYNEDMLKKYNLKNNIPLEFNELVMGELT